MAAGLVAGHARTRRKPPSARTSPSACRSSARSTRSPRRRCPASSKCAYGIELFYTDADGNYLLQGNLIDTKQQRNLTEERIDKLWRSTSRQLPVKDAFTIVRGNGKRKLAVFEDPNCGYCKHFERDLQKVDNVTVYMFLYPILGPDSTDKSRNIWCAKDKAKAWQDWMVRDAAPRRRPAATPPPWRATSSSARSTRSPARPR